MKKATARVGWVALFTLLWATGIVAFYFVVHRPWSVDGPLALAQAGLDLFSALALIVLAGGLGRRLSGGALPGLHPLERLAIQAALGLGVTALVGLAIGLVGGLRPWVTWLGLAVGGAALMPAILGWLGELRQALAGLFPAGAGARGRWLAAFVLAVCLLQLLIALAPPTAWDSLAYHLQLPGYYLHQGQVAFYPQNLYSGFPQTAEMNYLWALGLRGHLNRTALPAPAVLGWLVGLLALLGLEGFSRRLLGDRLAWLAPAILLSGGSLSRALSSAYVDAWLLLFGLAGLVCLERYLAGEPRRWLWLSGMLAGFALGTKYTAGVFLLAGLGALSWAAWEARREPVLGRAAIGWLRDSLGFCLAAGLVALPWLVKNALLVGDPFYPAALMNTTLDPWQQHFTGGASLARSFWSDLLLPVEATLFGLEKAAVIGRTEYGANLGPLALAFIPGLLIGWRHFPILLRRSLGFLLAAVATTWVVWAGLAHLAAELAYARHFYALFPALAILAEAGFSALAELRWMQLRLGRLAGAVLGLGLALAGLTEINAFVSANPLPVILGRQSQAGYLVEQLGWYAPAVQSLDQLPPGSRTLLLWEPRSLYCPVECWPDATLHNWWYLRQAAGSAEQIVAALRQAGVTHLLIHQAGADLQRQQAALYTPGDWQELERFLQAYGQPLETFGAADPQKAAYSLYTLLR